MERLWKSDLGDGNFKNPVLFADYSDPDIIRVGDTYYLTHPALTIFRDFRF